MKLLVVLSWLFNSFAFPGQDTTRVRELENILNQAENDKDKAQTLYQISLKYRDSDPKLAVAYSKNASVIAKKTGDLKLLGSIESAIGTGYYMLGDFDNAMIYYLSALRIREGVQDSAGISNSYNNIANIYNVKGDYEKALYNYDKALKLGTALNDIAGNSSTLINIGNIYLAQEDYDKALTYYKKSLPIKLKLDEKEGIVICYINMGMAYTGKKNYALAISYYNKALPIADEIGSLIDKVYALRGKADAHLQSKQYEKAILNAEESLTLALQSNGKDEIKHSASVLNDIYEAMGNYPKAHKYLTLFSIYNDSITSEQVTNQIAEAQVKYETEKKAKANLALLTQHELHKKEVEQKSILQYLTIAMLIFVCIISFIFLKGWQHLNKTNGLLKEKNHKITITNNELNSQQHELEMQALELQIQKNELERISSIKDRLFSVIAHDLRGPLVSLKGLLHVMSMGGIPEEKRGELFKSLVKGQQNVLWMLDNLFDWARAQMKGFEVEKQPLSVRSLTEENIRLLLPIAINKDIRVENRIPDDIIVFADKEMLRLVLRNLISNAIKFCRAGDLIAISSITLHDVCTITVQDTGVGISEDVQQKLFSKSGYTSRGTNNEKGSGLGLALCKDFIVQNGGTIWVESTLGKGSAFKFTLPAGNNSQQHFENITQHTQTTVA